MIKVKIIISIAIIVILSLCGVAGYFAYGNIILKSKLSETISDDSRNAKIQASVKYENWINHSAIVFSIDGVGEGSSRMDVFRLFLQFADKMKNDDFETVILACKGEQKYKINGSYFKTLGEEYSSQNPVYTIRTFPENVMKMDGDSAFGKWTGGILGVLSNQMKDFAELHDEWYSRDLNLF